MPPTPLRLANSLESALSQVSWSIGYSGVIRPYSSYMEELHVELIRRPGPAVLLIYSMHHTKVISIVEVQQGYVV